MALLALGTGTIVVLILVGTQLQDRLAKDAAGVDLVVGAKGATVGQIGTSARHAMERFFQVRFAHHVEIMFCRHSSVLPSWFLGTLRLLAALFDAKGP